MRVFALVCAVMVGALSSVSRGQYGTGPYEVVPNETKAMATANQGTWNLPPYYGVTSGVIIGATTPSSVQDTFRLRCAPHAPSIYRHRLFLNLPGPLTGVTGSIRGLTQTNGSPNFTSDEAVQTVSGSLPAPRFNQFYSFGEPAELYYRVSGTQFVTADYSVDYEQTEIAPMSGPENLPAGEITITTEVAGGYTVSDLWVYDSQFRAIPGYGNSRGTLAGYSILTRTYVPGTYYLAISDRNLANSYTSPPDDWYRNGNILDFPGVLTNSTRTARSLGVSIGGVPVTAFKDGPYDVAFIRFTVPSAGVMHVMGMLGLLGARRRSQSPKRGE